MLLICNVSKGCIFLLKEVLFPALARNTSAIATEGIILLGSYLSITAPEVLRVFPIFS